MTQPSIICIFSIARDQTTTDVMAWLRSKGHFDVIRINSDADVDEDPVLFLTVGQEDLKFWYQSREVHLADIAAVWYRKGGRWLCNRFLAPDFEGNQGLTQHLQKRIQKEELRLSEYLHDIISSTKPTLGSPSKCDLNKLLVLSAARQVGLLVPEFHISNSTSELTAVIAEGKYITKAISDIVYLFDEAESGNGYYSYTEELEYEHLSKLPDRLSPSFVQRQILKRFDARVFYLAGECYAMAIISQQDEQTRVDFRRYNYKKPNRTIPLRLPQDVESKLRRLFEKIKLNTGSVDFVVDLYGHYYFLEINAVGQFAQVSSGCNYYLEKLVAEHLEACATERNITINRNRAI